MVSPAKDVTALADAILSIYNMSEDERNQMGAKGRSYYKKFFNSKSLAEQLSKYLELALNNRGSD
jgi:glycosyltransferase involved in cell wall biosynthesis